MIFKWVARIFCDRILIFLLLPRFLIRDACLSFQCLSLGISYVWLKLLTDKYSPREALRVAGAGSKVRSSAFLSVLVCPPFGAWLPLRGLWSERLGLIMRCIVKGCQSFMLQMVCLNCFYIRLAALRKAAYGLLLWSRHQGLKRRPSCSVCYLLENLERLLNFICFFLSYRCVLEKTITHLIIIIE